MCEMTVPSDMLVEHGELSTADTRADITQPIVVSDLLMLIIGIALASLGSVEHHAVTRLSIRTDKCTTTGGSDHLIAIEAQHAKLSEHTADTTFIT